MKVILLKDVKKIGRKYDIKDVADGFALNMLIPKKDAIPATPGNVKMIESKKNADLAEIQKNEAELMKALNGVKGLQIEIKGKVNDKGHLFAGIHKEEVIKAVEAQKNIVLNPDNVVYEKPIKEVGEHPITVKVGTKEAVFKLVIKAE